MISKDGMIVVALQEGTAELFLSFISRGRHYVTNSRASAAVATTIFGLKSTTHCAHPSVEFTANYYTRLRGAGTGNKTRLCRPMQRTVKIVQFFPRKMNLTSLRGLQPNHRSALRTFVIMSGFSRLTIYNFLSFTFSLPYPRIYTIHPTDCLSSFGKDKGLL